MIKVIILILIVLVLASACGGPTPDQLPVSPPIPAEDMTNLVYLGRVDHVKVYRFNDGDTVCWMTTDEYSSDHASIYCK